MLALSGVATVNEVPYATEDGADEIVGRAPLKRYGGEKISAVRWSATPVSEPPPATRTRASGSSTAVEWYRRGVNMLAIVVHVPVTGDQSSAGRTALPVLNDDRSVPPPVASALPSGSIVRLRNDRGNAIEPVGAHVGDGRVMSMVNAVVCASPELPLSAAVPALRNLPG